MILRKALKGVVGVVGLIFVAFFLHSSSSFAVIGTVPTHQTGKCSSYLQGPGDGHDIPTPFDVRRQVNRRVELANGEKYLLWGEIKFPYFKVDLHQHPWLKTSSKAQKYYFLDGTAADWATEEGRSIQLFCKAHLRILKFEDGREEIAITLERLK